MIARTKPPIPCSLLAAEPLIETDAAKARFAQRHERALLDPAAEVSGLGVAHHLTPSKQESAPSETGRRCGNVRRRNPERPRSGWGHKQTSRRTQAMSALLPKADID